VLRAGHRVPPAPTNDAARDRSVRRRVGVVWGLLVLNTLDYTGSLIPMPTSVGKALTQAALPVALVLALTVNRRIILRPNVFLCLLVLLTAEAVVTSLQPEHFGTVYRTFRLAEFVAALWLLTPWWGRRDMLLVRCHLVALSVVLTSVVVGLLVAPGRALATGRLAGALWNVPATQVAHYAAVIMGVTVILWLCGRIRGRRTLLIVGVAAGILLATHTRTALVALIAGLLVAGLSLIVARQRVRKAFAIAGAATAVAIMTLSGFITSWLARGQGTSQLTNLTGRTAVWGPLLAYPRDRFQEIFGFGLSNDSFNGLPIDSNWLASYQAQGLFGVTLCAIILIFLLVAAYFRPRGMERALALFFITYCLVASFTEVGFTNASPYLLELTLAASLLVPPGKLRREPSSGALAPPLIA
jgi:hypothetical protein